MLQCSALLQPPHAQWHEVLVWKSNNGALPDTLGNDPVRADLYVLQGKICDTSDLRDKDRYGGYYGYCE